MPTREDDAPRGRGLRNALFWAGVVLAPVAIGLLLLADGNTPLRIAAVLGVVAVVLIGLSGALRRDPETIRMDIEDEIESLRAELRNGIATAARGAHNAFGERLQALQQQVEALRGQLDAARSGPRGPVPAAAGYQPHPNLPATAGPSPGYAATQPYAATPAAAPAVPTQRFPAPEPAAEGGQPHAGGLFRHTETVQVTTRHTIVDDRGEGSGNVYGGRRHREDEAAHRGGDRRQGDYRAADHRPAGHRGAELDPYRSDWHRPDDYHPPSADDDRHGRPDDYDRYGRSDGYRADDYHPRSADEDRHGRPDEHDRYGRSDGYRADDYHPRSADDYRHGRPDEHDRYGRSDGYRADDHPAAAAPEESWTERWLRERRPDDDQPYSGVSAGDRWAAVRTGDGGRELRLGERRAELQADAGGAELRVEDRWASVRREDLREAGEYPGWGAERSWGESTAWPTTGNGGAGRGSARAALPAGGVDPAEAWSGSWSEPAEREPAEREPARGARSFGFESTDSRWR
jgi:hypothetical protein